MKALTFQGKEKIQYSSIPEPEILSPTDVIVRVKVCAICGSDLHVYHEREKGIDSGTAMGHEFVGEIVETGKGVTALHKGDIVMSPFTTSCGQCYYCRIGLTCRCVKSQLFGWVEQGKGLQGGQAEYVRIPMADSTSVKIPEGISLEEGLLLGDVLSTGFFCAHQAEVKPNGTYVVVGLGPVGMMAILGALELGAKNIGALDTIPSRLAMAARFGATALNAMEGNPLEAVAELTEGRGADAVMEAVGSGSAVKLAVSLVRPGGIISSVGVCTDDHLAFTPAEAYNKNLTYKIGRCPARFMMDQLIPLVQRKKYDITSLFTHDLNLSEGESGYKMFAEKKDNCMKILLRP